MNCIAVLFGITIFLNPIVAVFSFCHEEIRNGVGEKNFGSSYDLTSVSYNEQSFEECECGIKSGTTCIRKCCAPNYILENKTCEFNSSSLFDVSVHEHTEMINKEGLEFRFLFGMVNCAIGYYKLEPLEYPDDAFFVQRDGRLWQPVPNEMINYDHFCLDYFGNGEVAALVCFPDDAQNMQMSGSVNALGMIISMVFLLITFIVYALLPDRNLHGKALMCYVITLFGAYLLLVLIQLYPHAWDNTSCKALGLSCLFFFMVSFCWMNVMSIDIWWAFSGLRGFSGSKKQAERKRFLVYSAYAWGMPLLHVILVISLTLSPSLSPFAWYNPGMGEGKCWFRDGIPTLVYFYGPMAVLIIANITFFIITACKIKQVQQDTAMLRKDESKKHTYENDKQRFNLYIKLMLAMGVNWIMEIISWAVIWQVGVVPPAVWYLTDFINALYGVFIFFIFVFKRNILKLLKRRYYMLMGKPHLARSMTQTAYSPRTTASSLSQTVTTDTKSFVNDSSVLTSEVA